MIKKLWDSPEIYCIPVELPQNPLRVLNAYIIKTPAYSMLIDTGFNRPECHTALWSGIQELGLDLHRTVIFLTHLHSDHSGLAWDFVNQGCPVYMGRIDYNYLAAIKRGEIWPIMEKMYQNEGYPSEELALQGQGNQGRKYAVDRIFPAIAVDDGKELSLDDIRIQCIHTPGHTPGHMVLYLPEEQILFSGDHILFDITPNISVWHQVPYSLSDYITSLQKISVLPIRATFPAHRNGGEDVYRRIDEIIEHHSRRLEEIYQTVKAHPGTSAFQLAGLITWSVHGLPWEKFPPHQKWFAMSETLAHLNYLTDKEQLLRVKEKSSIRYY